MRSFAQRNSADLQIQFQNHMEAYFIKIEWFDCHTKRPTQRRSFKERESL